MAKALFCTVVLLLLYNIESKKTTGPDDPCITLLLAPFLPKLELSNSIDFCQEDNGETQYLSSYDIDYNLAVFSAAIVETPDPPNDRGTRTAWTQGMGGLRPDWRPTDEDYKAFEDFDKGHLFPWAYSKDIHQAKSTMRLTNAVPQDKVFNQQVWSKAEDHLKQNFIKVCNSAGYTSIVVTGAVPAYFGLDNNGDLRRGYDMRIGDSENSRRASYEALPQMDFSMLGPQLMTDLIDRLTVPTHMWTYFVCYDQSSKRVTSQTSYIGLNYKTGVIKWYQKFTDFSATLTKMYQKTPAGNITPDILNAVLPESADVGPDGQKFCKAGKSLRRSDMTCDTDADPGTAEEVFWDKANIHTIRKKNEERRLNFLLSLYGQAYERNRDTRSVYAFQAAMTSDESMGARRKRSANKDEEDEEDDDSEVHTLITLDINDKDPNSDFELSTCELLEKSTIGKVQETHTFDFKRNVLIKDRTPGGSVLTAKYFINGTETVAQEGESNNLEINIVLHPRKTPGSPGIKSTTTTTTKSIRPTTMPSTTAPSSTSTRHEG